MVKTILDTTAQSLPEVMLSSHFRATIVRITIMITSHFLHHYMYITFVLFHSTAKHQSTLIEWLNGLLPDLRLPPNAPDEQIRTLLIDGSALCRLLNRLKPGAIPEVD